MPAILAPTWSWKRSRKAILEFQRGDLHRFAWPTRSTARRRGQSAMLETMRRAPVTAGTRYQLKRRSSSLATQTRSAGEDLPPAGSPARPILVQAARRLFGSRPACGNRRPHHAARDDRTGQVMDGKKSSAGRVLCESHPGRPRATPGSPGARDPPEGVYALPAANKFIRWGQVREPGAGADRQGPSILDGRYNVSFEDIRRVYLPALRYRIIVNFEAQAEGISRQILLELSTGAGEGRTLRRRVRGSAKGFRVQRSAFSFRCPPRSQAPAWEPGRLTKGFSIRRPSTP